MKTIRAVGLMESPVPVLVVLAALFCFIGYLDLSVLRQQEVPLVVRIPAAFSPDSIEALADRDAGGIPGASFEALVDAAAGGRSEDQQLQERALALLRQNRPAEALAMLEDAARLGGATASLHYNLGVCRSRLGDTAGAEAAYRRALELNPNFDEAWNNLGLLLSGRDDMRGAIRALERAVEASSATSRHRPLLNLARALARAGHSEEAIARLDEAIRLSPASIAPRLELAELVSQQPGGFTRARELYAQVIRLDPSSPSGHFALGLLESRAGDRAAAESAYRAALTARPGHRRSRYNLALLMLDDGRPGDAARQLESLASELPEPKIAFGLGRARRAQNDAAGAEAAYREAIRLAGGRYPEASVNLGILLADAERPAEAEAAYRDAIRQDPAYSAAWHNLSILLSDQKRPEDALDANERALDAKKDNERIWFHRGRLLSAAGKREEALAAYREAIRLRPDYTKAMLNAAVLHADAGHDEEAIRLYRQLLKIDPGNSAGWFNLGLALHRANHDDEARIAYEAALKADPEGAMAARNLGVLYARAGRIEEARRTFAEALERHPQDVALRYNLALQLEKLARTAEAGKEMERVVILEPGHEKGWRALARLLRVQKREEEAARALARADGIARSGAAAPQAEQEP